MIIPVFAFVLLSDTSAQHEVEQLANYWYYWRIPAFHVQLLLSHPEWRRG